MNRIKSLLLLCLIIFFGCKEGKIYSQEIDSKEYFYNYHSDTLKNNDSTNFYSNNDFQLENFIIKITKDEYIKDSIDYKNEYNLSDDLLKKDHSLKLSYGVVKFEKNLINNSDSYIDYTYLGFSNTLNSHIINISLYEGNQTLLLNNNKYNYILIDSEPIFSKDKNQLLNYVDNEGLSSILTLYTVNNNSLKFDKQLWSEKYIIEDAIWNNNNEIILKLKDINTDHLFYYKIPPKSNNKNNCEEILYNLVYTSNFNSREKYDTRIEDIRNDTIIIKAFKSNNLSDDPKVKQIVENAVGWFIIPPKKDELYLSFNALDPEEPNFKKIKTNKTTFNHFINCFNQEINCNIDVTVNFSNLFNEGTIIKFTPKDLDKNEPDIVSFKQKLETFNKNTNIDDFDEKNLSILINNETFFDLQYYTDSSWLQYFITKYKIDVSKLNNIMRQAIIQEDYNAVGILIKNHYIVSKKDLEVSSVAEKDSKNKIQENKTDGYESYLVSKSKIHQINILLKNSYSKNHIQDNDSYTNLREEQNSKSKILQQIKSGENINVLSNTGDWYLVETKEGNKGYIHKSRIKSK